jgi:hypothetical protein
MTIARVRPSLHHHLIAAGSVLCVAAMVAWMTATAFGQSAFVKPPLAPAHVLVSVGTLDMSRLVPAQFGDWDAADHPTR